MKMSKKSRLFLIYFVSGCLFLVLRYIVSVLPIGDNYVNWLFSVFSQLGLNFALVVGLFFALNRDGRLGDVRDTLYLNISKKRFPIISIVIVALLPFLLRYATIGVSYSSQIIINALGFTSVSGVHTIYSSPWVLIMSIITTAVLPAFCEEVYNRGLLLSAVEDRPDDIYKVLLIGVMFGLFHQNIQQFFYTVFGGCVFAVLTIKFRSIWPAVYCHFINNFLDVIYDYSSQVGNGLGDLYDGYYTFVGEHFLLAAGSWMLAFLLVIGVTLFIGKIIPTEQQDANVEKGRFSVAIGDVAEPLKPASEVKKSFIAEYGFLIATIVVMGLSTIFTFIWGVLR